MYVPGEAPSLGVAASSRGDFSGLIDSAQRSAFSWAKTMFSALEMDHLLKSMFKVFKVFSFLEWAIGALAKKIRDSDLPQDIAIDWRSVLSCADKAIRDGSFEISAPLCYGDFEEEGTLDLVSL